MLVAALDENAKPFCYNWRKKGGFVNTVAADATSKALIARSNDEHLRLFDVESTTWAKSFLRRIGFCKRATTTSKLKIPELAKGEAKLL